MVSLLGLSLSACKKNTTDTAAKPAETTAAMPATPAASPSTTGPSATSPAVTTPGAIPGGYTLLPALSSKPVYTFAAQPARVLKDGVNYVALIDTSKGQILADLYEDKTPATVNNFVALARNHFYDGILFHRVLDGFMGQTGDPNTLDAAKKTAWGQGGPGYSFPDEIRQSLKFDAPGLLAMANSGFNINGL